MDTWATSSLTPQIACGWEDDPDLFARTFPMDLRPQGPEIIRTWLFSTLLRSQLEHDVLPWKHTTINGWILDPDRKKMSKSKGNVVTPSSLVAEHGADGLRYWACQAALGVDTAADPAQMKVGRRLAIKLLNVSSSCSAWASATEPAARSPKRSTWPCWPAGRQVVDEATTAFDEYRYQPPSSGSDTFFWAFCDDYVELVKSRAYGDDAAAESARAALATALSTIQRLFAPFLPFATDEVWSWWQDGSVHRQPWPTRDGLQTAASATADPAVLDVAAAILAEVRKAKSTEKRGMRTEVSLLTVADTAESLERFARAESDVREAGNITRLETVDGPERVVTVELAPVDADAPAGRRAASPSDPRRSARAVLVGGGTPAPDPGRHQPHPDHDQHRPEHREERVAAHARALGDVDPLQDPHHADQPQHPSGDHPRPHVVLRSGTDVAVRGPVRGGRAPWFRSRVSLAAG